MKSDKNRDRRFKAEGHLKSKPDSSELKRLSADELIHELRVHQVEIEMQNEELRRAQVALEEARDRYRDLYDTAPLAYYTLDLQGMITGVNPAGATLLGTDHEELLASGFSRFVAEFSRSEFHAIRNRAANTDARQHCEIELVRHGGTVVAVHAAIARVANPAGGPSLLRMALTDVTERKQTEQALRESENRFRQLANSLPQLIWTCLPNGSCDFVSRQWLEYTGVAAEPQLGFGWLEQVHPDDRESTVAAWNAAITGGSDLHVEFRIRRHDGEHRWFDARVVQLSRARGRAVKWLGSGTDITERKLTEQKSERLALTLSQNVEELRQIIYAASHDLRTPLVSVQGFVSELRLALDEMTKLLRDPGIPPAVKERVTALVEKDIPESLKFVESGVTRMSVLLSGLLQLARLDRTALVFAELDMNRVARDVLTAAEYQVKEAGARLEVERLPTCFGDSLQVGRVLANLVDNAVKYRDPARPLVVRVTGARTGTESVYCVADNGIGIAPGSHTRVFELFYRVSPREGSGDGLGLKIVKRIVDRLGGRVWMESEPGQGARFFFALPARRPSV